MIENTTMELVASVVLLLMLVVGMLGVVLPILPGSLIVILTLVAWGVLFGDVLIWVAAAVGIGFALLGWSASTILTSRTLHREKIPRGPILIAFVAALVGMFLLPPLGLFLGFALGLFASELLRRNWDFQAAGSASLKALRSIGIGLVVEFLLAGVATSCFVIGTLIYFFA